jgi:hypothetical protein
MVNRNAIAPKLYHIILASVVVLDLHWLALCASATIHPTIENDNVNTATRESRCIVFVVFGEESLIVVLVCFFIARRF